MVQQRAAYGYTYYSLSLADLRGFRSLKDIPRKYWAGLQRPATNYELRNRIDHRDGAWPQLGGVDHIGAGFQDDEGADTGAEALCEYGLSPGNTRASWNAGGDSDTVCLLLPGDTRPWQHGVSGSPYDLNSLAVGYEDGILSSDWRRLPRAKRLAHLRMRAAFWAIFFGDLGWPLQYVDNPNEVWRLIGQGRKFGLTQHGIMDPNNRSDAGLVWEGGRRINTFPYSKPVAGDPADATLFSYIRQEMAIRTGELTGTPGLPASTSEVKAFQALANDFGHTLDLDGSFGPLTENAAKELADLTDYKGDVKDVTGLTKHLEGIMSKIENIVTNAVEKGITRARDITGGTLTALGYEKGTRRSLVWMQDIAMKNAIQGKRYALAAVNSVAEALRSVATVDAKADAILEALEKVGASTGMSPEEVRQIFDDSLGTKLQGLDAKVSITLARADDEAAAQVAADNAADSEEVA